MMPELWRDFIIQAKNDLKRARSEYQGEDYGAAAEDTQHALEVLLKAYLMRYQLITNPGEVNHMKMVSVLTKVQARAESIVTKFGKSKKFIISTGKARTEVRKLGEILKELQPKSGDDQSEEMKIKLQLWKYSLTDKIDSDYEQHLKKLSEEIKARLKPIMDDFIEYYDNQIRPTLDKIPDTTKEAAVSKYVKDSGFHTQVMADVIRGKPPVLRPEDAFLYMIVLLMFLEKLFNEEGKQPEQWQFYRDAKEVYLLMYPFRFLDTIIKTYPHQDIGRYPNYVDGQSTLTLYKTYSLQLDNLMRKVEEDCARIENAINGKWNDA